MNNIINAQTKVEMQPKVNLLGLSKRDLFISLNRLGVEKKELSMRVQQLFSWIHVHGKKNFDEMTNLSKEFRYKLSNSFSIYRPQTIDKKIQFLHRMILLVIILMLHMFMAQFLVV